MFVTFMKSNFSLLYGDDAAGAEQGNGGIVAEKMNGEGESIIFAVVKFSKLFN
jgi:hypothetical protein